MPVLWIEHTLTLHEMTPLASPLASPLAIVGRARLAVIHTAIIELLTFTNTTTDQLLNESCSDEIFKFGKLSS